MICPDDVMPMQQKSRIGDGELTSEAQASWMLLECPVCGLEVVEFKTVFLVGNIEEARVRGGLLIAQAMAKGAVV